MDTKCREVVDQVAVWDRDADPDGWSVSQAMGIYPACLRAEFGGDKEMAHFLMDMFHRLMVHYALWFRGAEYHLGMGKALDIMETAWGSAYQTQIERMARIANFEVEDGIPKNIAPNARRHISIAPRSQEITKYNHFYIMLPAEPVR